MKKNVLLFVFSFCTFLLVYAASAPQTIRDIKLQVEQGNDPVINSIGLIPFAASIENEIVSVDCLLNTSVTIRIINTSTGEVVNECVYSAAKLSVLPISLEGEAYGEYKLEICSEGTVYFGIFILC